MTRINRAFLSEPERLALDTATAMARARRDRNRAAGACINETLDGRHGPATHGCRCERCARVHAFGASQVKHYDF